MIAWKGKGSWWMFRYVCFFDIHIYGFIETDSGAQKKTESAFGDQTRLN